MYQMEIPPVQPWKAYLIRWEKVLNSVGAIEHPCCTPRLIENGFDSWPRSFTQACPPSRRSFMIVSRGSGTLKPWRIIIDSSVLFTVPYVLTRSKSKYMFCSNDLHLYPALYVVSGSGSLFAFPSQMAATHKKRLLPLIYDEIQPKQGQSHLSPQRGFSSPKTSPKMLCKPVPGGQRSVHHSFL